MADVVMPEKAWHRLLGAFNELRAAVNGLETALPLEMTERMLRAIRARTLMIEAILEAGKQARVVEAHKTGDSKC